MNPFDPGCLAACGLALALHAAAAAARGAHALPPLVPMVLAHGNARFVGESVIRLINTAEPGDRGLYAGPVGWVDGEGNGEFAVGLRSSHVTGDAASIWAGVGVVGESDPESELAETRAKFQAMLGALLRP